MVDAVHAGLEGVNIVSAGEVLRGDLYSGRKKQRQDREEGMWRHGRGRSQRQPALEARGLYRYTRLSAVLRNDDNKRLAEI